MPLCKPPAPAGASDINRASPSQKTTRRANNAPGCLRFHAVVPNRLVRAMKFKLKDEVELHVSDHVQFYARALRAIGQDLSGLFPQTLEIRLAQGGNFEVNGRHVPRVDLSKSAPKERLLDKLRNKLLRDEAAEEAKDPAGVASDFTRMYTAADIQRLDEAAANHRGAKKALPDIHSLGEMLRMVGRIIDSNGKRLVRVSRNQYGVTFEYEDNAGKTCAGELSSLQLYKLQQEYYAERGSYVPVDTWKGSL
jgi:hypothetical protein